MHFLVLDNKWPKFKVAMNLYCPLFNSRVITFTVVWMKSYCKLLSTSHIQVTLTSQLCQWQQNTKQNEANDLSTPLTHGDCMCYMDNTMELTITPSSVHTYDVHLSTQRTCDNSTNKKVSKAYKCQHCGACAENIQWITCWQLTAPADGRQKEMRTVVAAFIHYSEKTVLQGCVVY